MRLLLTLLFLSVGSAYAQTSVASLPNQKEINNSYVSNPDRILSPSDVLQIDTLLAQLEKKTTAQVAVVVVQSIGDADLFDFAQKLFEKWHVGQKSNDNGLLLILVMDKHEVRFHTGFGLEGILPDATCKRIQMEYMVPKFKEGDYSAGIIAGLEQVSDIISNPNNSSEVTSEAVSDDPWTGFLIFLGLFFGIPIIIAYFIKSKNGRFFDSTNRAHSEYPEMWLSRLGWISEFVLIPIAILIAVGVTLKENPMGFAIWYLYFFFAATFLYRIVRMQRAIRRLLKTESYYEIVELLRAQQWRWFFTALLFPVPFLPYFFYHLYRKRAYRNHARKCKVCGESMKKLSEKDEDQFLSQAQQTEETLKSIDYDVWQCEGCRKTETWMYPNRHSKYKECPYCHTHAYYKSGTRTIESATYTSSGTGEETHTCKYCNRSKSSTFTIAQLVASSSSSSSSDSSWSSSDSGGSWGGGDSGGGGASSSW